MKTLYESILSDIDTTLADNCTGTIKNLIKDFLRKNYGNFNFCKISSKPNKDGKYIVNSDYAVSVKNLDCTSLTNGYFIFGTVKGTFNCSFCKNLASLEGAPKNVGIDFYCQGCAEKFTKEHVKSISNVKGKIYA